MQESELLLLALAVWGICWGASHFVANEVLRTVGAVAAIVTGILCIGLLL